jgi:hypothetical protein
MDAFICVMMDIIILKNVFLSPGDIDPISHVSREVTIMMDGIMHDLIFRRTPQADTAREFRDVAVFYGRTSYTVRQGNSEISGVLAAPTNGMSRAIKGRAARDRQPATFTWPQVSGQPIVFVYNVTTLARPLVATVARYHESR